MGETQEFDTAVEQAWREFRGRLAERLARMSGSDRLSIGAYRPGHGMTLPPRVEMRLVRNRLIASVREKHGPTMGRLRWEACLAYLEGSWWDAPNAGARARWQRHSWWLKTSPQYVDFLAVEVVRLLQEGFGVAHPTLLDVDEDVWDATPPGPKVGADADPEFMPAARMGLAHPVKSRDELESLVLATLAPRLGHVPVRDEDGDVPIVSEHVVTFVRIPGHTPVVELLCWPVLDITDLRAARVEVDILARDYPVVSFTQDENRILARAVVLASPYVPAHLDSLLTSFIRTMDSVTVDLASRVRGRRWLDDAAEEGRVPHEQSDG